MPYNYICGVAKKNKKNKQITMGFAPTDEDLKLMDELRAKYAPSMGVISQATVLRMGIRKLAESEGLNR